MDILPLLPDLIDSFAGDVQAAIEYLQALIEALINSAQHYTGVEDIAFIF